MIGNTWSRIQHGIEIASAGVSFALNSLLIFLILRHSPKALGPYKYLMIYISVFELFYSFMDVIVSPIFHSYGSSFLVLMNLKESIFDMETGIMLTSIYCGCFGSSMAIFGIHFIYRYLVATGHNLLATFHTWKITIWFMIPMIYGAMWGLVAYFPLGRTPESGEHIRSNIMETFGWELEETVYIGAYFYQEKPNGKYEIDFDSVWGMSVLCFIVGSSFFTIIYFGVKCYSKIRELTPSSKTFKSRALQSHLFWALCVQTVIPVLLMHVPVTFVNVSALLDRDIGMLGGLVSITIAVYPAVDPLPTLIIIPHYRKALLNYLCLRSESPETHMDDSKTGQQSRTSATRSTELSRSRVATTAF